MSNIKYIIFDFDGTIADTIDLALNIYNRIAPEYNCNPIKEEDRGILRARKPQDLLKEYGVTNLKLILILLRIRKEIINLIPEIKLVNGIKDSLKEIINSGLRVGILTSNSRHNVNIFLEKNNLSDIIDFIYSGKNLFGKDRVIRRLLDHENISREDVIYIGDETRDIEASRQVGIPVIAVSWGLNNREILDTLQPDQIADTPKDLFRCVQQIIINEHFT
jgi:HAD superfamily hydrolase (TIGR01549 family)